METLNDDKLAYLGDYKDTIDVLPMELQRNFTLIRQLDDSAQDLMGKVAHESIALCQSQVIVPEIERKRRLIEIGNLLNESVKRGEEKFALAKSTYDAVDRHCSRLDNDLQKFEDEQWIGPSRMGRTRSNSLQQQDTNVSPTTTTRKLTSTRPRKIKSTRTGHKRKQELDQEQGDYLSTEDAVQHAQTAINLSDLPIDPNEPVYCYCRMVSYGEMVACDNDECDIEWFHLDCVGLRAPPKGKWYCKNCASEVKGKKKL
ncbi:uncharacterized protein BX664DRAFT_335391 [Halteromyces radiatus]|uniref:uncharacterized protein n=1 Tax=Halteromyces radiatus TaxID=101107 RepID=UPI00221FAD68|nr:uncharacterized protein BX664DRAFT_335391 [Halteromyces radiatus]KAI8086274.1 hypothetical protein BX664DRAFT_335391 [Halteromyces radiatus]